MRNYICIWSLVYLTDHIKVVSQSNSQQILSFCVHIRRKIFEMIIWRPKHSRMTPPGIYLTLLILLSKPFKQRHGCKSQILFENWADVTVRILLTVWQRNYLPRLPLLIFLWLPLLLFLVLLLVLLLFLRPKLGKGIGNGMWRAI